MGGLLGLEVVVLSAPHGERLRQSLPQRGERPTEVSLRRARASPLSRREEAPTAGLPGDVIACTTFSRERRRCSSPAKARSAPPNATRAADSLNAIAPSPAGREAVSAPRRSPEAIVRVDPRLRVARGVFPVAPLQPR